MGKRKPKKRRPLRKTTRKPPVTSLQEIKKFVGAGDFDFWLAHGCNYLNSSYEDGLWVPVFPKIYHGGLYTHNQIITYLTNLYFSEGEWSSAGKILAAWASQDHKKVYLFYRKVLKDIKGRDAVQNPHSDGIWQLFDAIKSAFEESFAALS